MKKYLAAILTALAMTAGLLVGASAPSSAACPYVGCARTTTTFQAPAKVARGNAPVVKARVRTQGNAVPKGVFKVIARGTKGNAKGTRVTRIVKVNKNGRATIALPKNLKLGRYSLVVRYVKQENSAFKSSGSKKAPLRVVRRK